MHYEVRGHGRSLLLTDVPGTNSAVWKRFEATINETGRQIITIDNRGTGQSGYGGSSSTNDDMVDDAAILIEEVVDKALLPAILPNRR